MNIAFPWNLKEFPLDGSGCEITIPDGISIKLLSDDDRVHDVIECNSNWEPINRISNKSKTLECIYEPVFKTSYLICSRYDKIMRLKIIKGYAESKGYNIKRLTIKSKPQIITMEDGTRIRIVTKPVVLVDDEIKAMLS